MNTQHAVLTHAQLTINEGGRVSHIHTGLYHCSIADAYELAKKHDITHLWLGIAVDMQTPETYDMFATYADEEKTIPMFARIYKKGVYGEVKVGWPHNGNWGWQITGPIDILATIHYLEQVLQVPVEWSPGHMGTELVKHLNRTARREEWVRDSTIDLFALPFKRAARDVIWKTGLAIDASENLWLHQYDKRSAYLAACQDLYVGEGDPVHVEGPHVARMDYTLPGIYRIEKTINTHPAFDDIMLPTICTTEWVTSDVFNYSLSQGYQVRAIEGYQWTEKHKTLKSYADKLWNSRKVFREDYSRFPHQLARQNAENTMKTIALVATGKFASAQSGAFKQPYWWAAVVGKARVNILANVAKIYDETGMLPALIYSDSVYYASTSPNPREAVPGILDREDKLGGFRHDGTWKVSTEMVEQFHSEKAGAIQKWLEHSEKEVII